MNFDTEIATEFANDCSDWIKGDCVSTDESGVVQVSLSVPRTIWFEFVRLIRGGLQVTCSAAGVMGVGGTMSVRTDESGGPVPASECGLFSPNLTEFASLWALREIHPDGTHYLLEVRDARGCPSQRILIPPSSLDSYFDFVSAFQAPPHKREIWFSPNHADGAHRRKTLSQRIPRLRRLHQSEARDVVSLTLSDIEKVLSRAVEKSQTLRTTVYNRAIIQGSIWTPEMISEVPFSADEPIEVTRFFGGGTGFELIHNPRLTAWLWTGQCACCSEQKWALEVGGPDDELCFAIRAVNERHENEWRQFLLQTLES